MAEDPRAFSQDHRSADLCGESWTLPPIGKPDFLLRRQEGLRRYLPTHEAEGKNGDVGWVSLHGRLRKQPLCAFRPVPPPQLLTDRRHGSIQEDTPILAVNEKMRPV